MIYKEISYEDYLNLQDKTGAYLVIHSNGTKSWWIHGHLHREDGPAVKMANGDKEWWIHGDPHREDGPAYEWLGGIKEWFLHGIWYLTEEEWEIALDELRAKEIKEKIV